jgi:hypothetical protein
MKIKETIEVFLLFITALAASVAGYATYRTYDIQDRQYQEQHEQPSLSVAVFKIVGKEEVPFSNGIADCTLKKLSSEGGFDNYELPLKIINSSNKDADDITVHVDVENGELILPEGWFILNHADNPRYYTNHPGLSPLSSNKRPIVKLRIKSNVHEVKLHWAVLAKNCPPKDDTIILHF